MKYKCINKFLIPLYDEDGFNTGCSGFVEEGTTWILDNDTSLIGGEVHLESINSNDFGWIEITNIDFKQNFKVIEKYE